MNTERGVNVQEISRHILDFMPIKGQSIVSLDGQTYLLSVSANVGEDGACKLWIQGREAIKVDGTGPVEDFNQLIYKARVLDNPSSVVLLERYGYASIPEGSEIDFLKRLLTVGEHDWFNSDEQDWGKWIGARD